MSNSKHVTFYLSPLPKQNLHAFRLLHKILRQAARAVVLCDDDEQNAQLTTDFWIRGGDVFLPHGNFEDGFKDKQPIWLTTDDENPNNASFLLTFEKRFHPDMLKQENGYHHYLCLLDSQQEHCYKQDARLVANLPAVCQDDCCLSLPRRTLAEN